MSGAPPTLTLSTGVTPSSVPLNASNTSSLRSRPHGARRRAPGLGAGLFVANPDNSDGEESSPGGNSSAGISPVRGSPQRSSQGRSPPAPIQTQGSAPISVPTSSSSTPLGTSAPASSGGLSSMMRPSQTNNWNGLPRRTPLPSVPVPGPSNSPAPFAMGMATPTPPQPPPQPDRHLLARRAFTSPTEQTNPRLDPRTVFRDAPSSPSRALPPLPPIKATSVPSPSVSNSPHATYNATFLPANHSASILSNAPPPLSAGSSSSLGRVPSPDDQFTASTINTRPRSSSVNQKVLLSATVDNEQFTIVDITGTQFADGIREKMLSRLRFRDDQFPTLAIYHTDVGEPLPDASQPGLSNQQLLQLVQACGDSKASLKFLVRQVSLADPGAATVVPPSEATFVPRTGVRPGVPPIVTNIEPAPPYTPHPMSSAHHSNGSMGSVSEAMDRGQGSRSSLNDTATYSAQQHTAEPTIYTTLPIDDASDDEGTFRLPSSNAVAGPSSASSNRDSFELQELVRSGMDRESARLVLQMRKEDEEEEHRRIRQDEAIALIAQENEREVWQVMVRLNNEAERQQYDRHANEHFDRQQAHVLAEASRTSADDRWQTGPSAPHGIQQFIDNRQQRREEMEHMRTNDWYGEDPAYGRRTSDSTAQYNTSRLPYMSSSPPQATEMPHGSSYTSGAHYQSIGTRGSQGDIHSRIMPPTPNRRPSNEPQPYYDQRLHNAPSLDNMRQAAGSYPHTNTRAHTMQPVSEAPYPIMSLPHRGSHDWNAGRYNTVGRTAIRQPEALVEFPSPRPSWPPESPHAERRPNSALPIGDPSPPLPRPTIANGSDYLNVAPGSRPRSTSDTRVQPQFVDTMSGARTEFILPPRRQRRQDSISTEASAAVSDTTIHSPDDGSGTATARAGDWKTKITNLISRGQGPVQHPDTILDSETIISDEATLFLPVRPGTDVNRFNLTLNTDPAAAIRNMPGLRIRPMSGSDSDTSGENDVAVGGGGVTRTKSFVARKNEWHVRPEPEQLYDNLQQFFPHVDLDKPIVDPAVSSQPSTPNSDSSLRNTFDLQRQQPPRVPPAPPVIDDAPLRRNLPPVSPGVQFNKAEHRKSIRNVAEVKKRSLQRNKERDNLRPMSVAEQKKIKRTSSMWDHRIVEVTARNGQDMPTVVPEVPEPPAADGRPTTLTWVKGELIGKGSYGRVYIALNVTTGDMMAVKQVELPATEEERNDSRQLSMVEALRSEISLLKDLYHPNIVAYLGCEVSTEYISIFLEYVPGGTISSIYRTPGQGRFEEELIKFFTRQILEGLAYLHGKHIWHRDLKGENILVDANGVCKISDFGISKQTSDAYDSFGAATNMRGTIFWMAPEVISSASYSGKVDIWSLGCVVLEMWSGQRPWGTFEPFAAMFALFQERSAPPLPKDIHLNEIADDFLYTKCLASDAKDRPTAVDLALHPFITQRDPSWTFADSVIGRAVAKRGSKNMRSASTSTASAASSGAVQTSTTTHGGTLIPVGANK